MTPLLRKANDDKAFERLYQRHAENVFRYSLAVLGEQADAEDVTQTTFLNAYRAFQRGERPEKPENWLIAIAHNVCRQRFRQQQRRPHEVEFEDELGGAVERDDSGPSLDELRRAFAALQPNQRGALVMRELEGRSYAEIAEVLGITVSALETLLFRARRALREQLEEQLSCRDAAFAISKQLDGRLPAGERRALRAHLRGCPECARLASSQRAQRKALRALFMVPLPQSLQTFLPHAGEAAAAGGSAAAAGGTALAVKAAAVVAAGTLVGGGAYEGATRVPPLVEHRAPAHHVAPKARAAHPVVRVASPVRPAEPARTTTHAAAVVQPKPDHRAKPKAIRPRDRIPTPPTAIEPQQQSGPPVQAQRRPSQTGRQHQQSGSHAATVSKTQHGSSSAHVAPAVHVDGNGPRSGRAKSRSADQRGQSATGSAAPSQGNGKTGGRAAGVTPAATGKRKQPSSPSEPPGQQP